VIRAYTAKLNGRVKSDLLIMKPEKFSITSMKIGFFKGTIEVSSGD
jgi:hypothetical protein